MNGRGLKVTVGVCGGIAAYKSVELVRLLQDAGYDPHVVMTRAAEEFVRPLTFAAISGHKVISTLWGEEAGAGAEENDSSIEHIQEAQTTKLLIVAPATADPLGSVTAPLMVARNSCANDAGASRKRIKSTARSPAPAILLFSRF